VDYIEANGLRVLNPQTLLKSIFCPEGTLTRKKPSLALLQDMDFGLRIARQMADSEIGQAVVVKNQAIVAVEGMEGTDRLIRRGGRLAGPGFVVVKAGRSAQDMRIDLPAVGLDTVRAVIQAGASALGLEASGVAFFQKKEAIELADRHALAIVVRRL
ncbi:MAG: LpxI family protein, partial [Acidobacteriota bacterium]